MSNLDPIPQTKFVQPGDVPNKMGSVPQGEGQHSSGLGYSHHDMDRSGPLEAGLMGEDVDQKFFDFNNKSIRRGFIRKVYGILSCQLLLTLGVIAFFVFCRPVKYFVMTTPAVLYTSMAVYFVLAMVLICVTEARRKSPLNYILLLSFTAATSYMLGAASATADIEEVLMAVGVTALICFALTIFAFQTKYDFTMCSGFLVCAILALLFFGIASAFYPAKWLNMLYASVGIIIFSFSLVYHTQLMVGGKHKYSVTPEEYVFAALTLYLDVVNIFIRILILMRSR